MREEIEKAYREYIEAQAKADALKKKLMSLVYGTKPNP
jgi:hypothetical protein